MKFQDKLHSDSIYSTPLPFLAFDFEAEEIV